MLWTRPDRLFIVADRLVVRRAYDTLSRLNRTGFELWVLALIKSLYLHLLSQQDTYIFMFYTLY
jgi:hypothetical protein